MLRDPHQTRFQDGGRKCSEVWIEDRSVCMKRRARHDFVGEPSTPYACMHATVGMRRLGLDRYIESSELDINPFDRSIDRSDDLNHRIPPPIYRSMRRPCPTQPPPLASLATTTSQQQQTLLIRSLLHSMARGTTAALAIVAASTAVAFASAAGGGAAPLSRYRPPPFIVQQQRGWLRSQW